MARRRKHGSTTTPPQPPDRIELTRLDKAFLDYLVETAVEQVVEEMNALRNDPPSPKPRARRR